MQCYQNYIPILPRLTKIAHEATILLGTEIQKSIIYKKTFEVKKCPQGPTSVIRFSFFAQTIFSHYFKKSMIPKNKKKQFSNSNTRLICRSLSKILRPTLSNWSFSRSIKLLSSLWDLPTLITNMEIYRFFTFSYVLEAYD